MSAKFRRAVFFLGLGALFAHELDAMVNSEWLLLPLFGLLSDQSSREVFLLAHVPLFALVVAYVADERERVRRVARLCVSAFLVVHAGLHLWFSAYADYPFHSWTSQSLIFGGAVLGGIYLVSSGGELRQLRR